MTRPVKKDENASFTISVNVECLIIPEYVLKTKKNKTLIVKMVKPCCGNDIMFGKDKGVPRRIK
jgi:hypothetical protein